MPAASRCLAMCMPAAAAAALLLASPRAIAQDEPCCTETEFMYCQDGLWCTGSESCNCWGDCEPGVPRNCDDGNWCTEDRCVDSVPALPTTGIGEGYCEHRDICNTCAVDADCEDGSVCTIDDCISGICFQMDVVCNDSTMCTDDTCDDALGCVFTEICDDANICTQDICNPDSTCSYPPEPCSDGNLCTLDLCDLATGCYNPPVDCDDGDICTTDACVAATGSCSHTIFDPLCCTTNAYCQALLYDGHVCSVESCNFGATPYPVCQQVMNTHYDTCATAGALSAAGGTDTMYWIDSGDLFCNANDYFAPTNYPNPPCGPGSGPDAVLTLTVPEDYSLHRYRFYAYDPYVLPTDFDPQVCLHYPYMQTAITSFNTTSTENGGVCGPAGNVSYALDDDRALMCADTGGGSCGGDATDPCTSYYRWDSSAGETRWPVLPDGSYNVIVDTGGGMTTGGEYTARLERVGTVSNHACDDGGDNLGAADSIEPPVIQMGGVWTGNTNSYGSTAVLEGVGYCTQTEMRDTSDPDGDGNCLTVTTPGGCGCDETEYSCFYKEYARAEYRIDHVTAPWSRNMGYVISTATPASGAFNTALSLSGETCQKGCSCNLNTYFTDPYAGCSGMSAAGCPIACDDDAGPAGGGTSRLVTGILPSGITATLSVHGFYPVGSGAAYQGNYKLVVQYDSDGDGLPDPSDTSALLSGDTYTLATPMTTNGPIVVPSLPFSDSRTSAGYANNLLGANQCRRYTRSCDIWGDCGSWGCANTVAFDANSRDVFYRYTNSSGAAQTVKVCARPLVDRSIWVSSYTWDSWAIILMTSTNGGASWTYYTNCEQVAEEEMRCLFEGDSLARDIGVGSGTTVLIGVSGLTDSTNTDTSRAGYYNFKACLAGTAGCDCGSWDYRP